jgi:hypothetical protein
MNEFVLMQVELREVGLLVEVVLVEVVDEGFDY